MVFSSPLLHTHVVEVPHIASSRETLNLEIPVRSHDRAEVLITYWVTDDLHNA